MFATVKQIFTPKNKDLRKKILFTLFVLLAFVIIFSGIVAVLDKMKFLI